MSDVFISYSHTDKFFAELLRHKLEEAKLSVWQDRSSLAAGDHWREAIDIGIDGSSVVIVALSQESTMSLYVTYEWSFGLAKEKPTLPVLIGDCRPHPKLEPIQYIDFRHHTEASWDALVQRVKEIILDSDREAGSAPVGKKALDQLSGEDKELGNKILAYMNRKNLRLLSYDRVRSEKMSENDNKKMQEFVKRHPQFRRARLRKGAGLAIV
ncbi:toll/interleukin-1 receptor domain-containing protein [Sulfitobacter pacificus]|uniref:toll/interleukin-1 receptor domain-containing protein n=1 Tax=Sulfitobacter pacificus TaxID=1499314 RepID=UPI003102C6A2